jgi:hypothetical protein
MQFWLIKLEAKRPLRRSRRKREDNIRMVLRKIRWEGVDWMHLAQDRDKWLSLVNTVVMKLKIPKKAGNLTKWVILASWNELVKFYPMEYKRKTDS